MSQINNEKLYLTIELIKNLLVAGGKERTSQFEIP